LTPPQETSQETSQETTRPLAQRLLWFAALWLGGVGTLAVIAFGLKLWLAPK
jgi:hypothetical protein